MDLVGVDEIKYEEGWITLEERHRFIFVNELSRQCQFVKMSFEDTQMIFLHLNQNNQIHMNMLGDIGKQIQFNAENNIDYTNIINDRAKLREENKQLNNDLTFRAWYSIQSFLISAGNISKFLWPPSSSPVSVNRGQVLRDYLKIDESSFLKVRNFRNHFEHFDERLDRWMSTRGNFISDQCIGGSLLSLGGGATEEDFLRNFNPQTFELSFKGEKYEMVPVYQEVCELYEKTMKR